MGGRCESGCRLLFLWFIGFPALAALVAVVFAGPMAAIEDVSFEESFAFLMAVMTVTDIPLTDWAGPTDAGGLILITVVSLVQLALLTVFVGISAGPLLDPFVDCLRLTPESGGGLASRHIIFYSVTFPAVALLFSCLAGGLLAWAEDWPFADGFVMVIGEVTNTHITVEGTPDPDTTAGKVVGLWVGVLAAAIFGMAIAIGSVPLLGHSLEFGRSVCYLDYCPFMLNSEQKEEILNKDEGNDDDAPKTSTEPRTNTVETVQTEIKEINRVHEPLPSHQM